MRSILIVLLFGVLLQAQESSNFVVLEPEEEKTKNMSVQELPYQNTDLDQKISGIKKEIEKLGEKALSLEEIKKQRAQIPASKNGLFLGIMAGSGLVNNRYEYNKYNQDNNVEGSLPVLGAPRDFNSLIGMFGGKIGYQNFFNRYFGTRIYGDALLGWGHVKSNGKNVGRNNYLLAALGKNVGRNNYLLAALNLDMLVDFRVHKKIELGGFVGFGFGVMLFSDQIQNVNLANVSWQSGQTEITRSLYSNGLWKHLLQIDYMVNFGVNVAIDTKHRIEIGVKIPVSQLRLGLEKPGNVSYTHTEKTKISENQSKVSISSGNEAIMSGDISFWRSSFFIIGYNYLF
ncbi:outer membrane beta-barrel protein [Helicobacter anatolicus]|uniref:outer membrane beta-barrel protein n=1 Tax=Helicobacter anatolicus TaxID=2905874 RepID=UPI001E3350E4|nr:outer membrane beta-barrel protein [Helicobacter anatolicus]MCE3038582.1 outer membrane protein [Helicobacter anatolicus]